MRMNNPEDAQRDKLCAMRVLIGFRAVSFSHALRTEGVFSAAVS